MKDPWEDVREAIGEFKEQRGTSDTFKVERLLTDADALLVQMRRVQFAVKPDLLRVLAKEQDKLDGEVAQRRAMMLRDFADLFEDIFVALPEHLKEET